MSHPTMTIGVPPPVVKTIEMLVYPTPALYIMAAETLVLSANTSVPTEATPNETTLPANPATAISPEGLTISIACGEVPLPTKLLAFLNVVALPVWSTPVKETASQQKSIELVHVNARVLLPTFGFTNPNK